MKTKSIPEKLTSCARASPAKKKLAFSASTFESHLVVLRKRLIWKKTNNLVQIIYTWIPACFVLFRKVDYTKILILEQDQSNLLWLLYPPPPFFFFNLQRRKIKCSYKLISKLLHFKHLTESCFNWTLLFPPSSMQSFSAVKRHCTGTGKSVQNKGGVMLLLLGQSQEWKFFFNLRIPFNSAVAVNSASNSPGPVFIWRCTHLSSIFILVWTQGIMSLVK